MTHKDIKTKFLIEYDKANVTSSYPSLTDYEIATILDKAYNALIAQKFTGNNTRSVAFEGDIKSMQDLSPLITTKRLFLDQTENRDFADEVNVKVANDMTWIDKKGRETDSIDVKTNKSDNIFPQTKRHNILEGDSNVQVYKEFRMRSMPDNMRRAILPKDLMYFVSAATIVDVTKFAWWMNEEENPYKSVNEEPTNDVIKPMDNKDEDYNDNKYKSLRMIPIKLVTHQMAEQFFATSSNIPWVKEPVGYIQDGKLFIIADPIVGLADTWFTETAVNPKSVNGDKGMDVNGNMVYGQYAAVTYIKQPAPFIRNDDTTDFKSNFELSNTMADELVTLAVTYALENVESTRLNTQIQMRGLES